MRGERPFLVAACLVLASWAEAPAFSPDCGPACHLWLPGPGIQANLYPYDQVTMDPLCENPPGSEDWLACNWASYFGVSGWSYDADDFYRASWEVIITGPGYPPPYTCELHLDWEPGSQGVEVTWTFVGQRPDLTRPGTYILRATFSNYPDPNPDPVCGPAGAEDPPVELDFTITVRRVPTDCPACPSPPLIGLSTAATSLTSTDGCTLVKEDGTIERSCGVTKPPPHSTDNLQIDACVLGCYIFFSVRDFRSVEAGVCSDNFVEVARTDEGIRGLDASTFCCGAQVFIPPPEGRNGCANCVTPPDPPTPLFASSQCIGLHEAKHVAMFEEELISQSFQLASTAALAPIPVTSESSCAEAMRLREAAIRVVVDAAYVLAWAEHYLRGELEPEAAEAACNQQLHDDICAWAQDDPSIDVDSCSYCAGYSD